MREFSAGLSEGGQMQKYEVSVKMPLDAVKETARLILSADRKLKDLVESGALSGTTVTLTIRVIGKNHSEKIALVGA